MQIASQLWVQTFLSTPDVNNPTDAGVLQANPDKAFDVWASKHQKVYSSEEERSTRLAVWLDNLAYIEMHNENTDDTDSHWVCYQHSAIMAMAILHHRAPSAFSQCVHIQSVITVARAA